ncbi:MAG: pilus assembly protein TadC [Candidatus Woesearchaeota archaeon]|jgi:pilus assembly protein TadC
MVDIIGFLRKRNPRLKAHLQAAHMNVHVNDYIARAAKSAALYGFMSTIIVLFPLAKSPLPFWVAIFVFPIVFQMVFGMQMKIPKAKIARRAKEIDNEVIFAGRFLLIKLSSGKPLFNALIDTSQSYGVSAKYFKEIVDDINFGTPIEQALQNALDTSPSRYFKKVLFQINSALKVGIDITRNLEVALEEIEHEQALEIERYSRKLSSVALFYMLGAIVVPSLGMTMFVVIASMLSFPLQGPIYIVILVLMIGIQLFFIGIFRQIRPSINV